MEVNVHVLLYPEDPYPHPYRCSSVATVLSLIECAFEVVSLQDKNQCYYYFVTAGACL